MTAAEIFTGRLMMAPRQQVGLDDKEADNPATRRGGGQGGMVRDAQIAPKPDDRHWGFGVHAPSLVGAAVGSTRSGRGRLAQAGGPLGRAPLR